MKNTIFKAMSVLLTLVMVFSVFACAVSTVSAATELTYYVKDAGSDAKDGLTQETALKTIAQAIKNAQNENLKAGDTLNIKLCEFPAVEWGNVPEYDFDVVVESNDVTLRSGVIIKNDYKFTGNVAFKNIRLDGSLSRVFYNDKNVSFDNKCAFAVTTHYMGGNGGTTATNSPIVTLGQALATKTVVIGDYNKGKIYNENATLNISNSTSTAKVLIGSESGTTIFQNNLNINVMDSKSITFLKNNGSVVVNGALQVVVSSNAAILNEDKAVLKDLNPAGGVWYITNATRVGDILDFTETAGKYLVDTERYAVKATDENGNEYIAADGILELPSAGEYVLTVKKEVETPNYYVSKNGNSLNDGLSPEKPLSAINEVIRAAVEAGYWEGDTVVVNVMDTVDWSNEFKINSTTEMVVDNYNYLLKVQSYNPSNISTVNFIYRQVMTGDTEFQNIKLNYGSQNGERPIYVNNHNLTYGENVNVSATNFTFGTFNGYGKFDGQTVIIKNALRSAIALGNNGHHNGRTFAEDVTLVLDNPKISGNLQTGCYHGGITTMKKNFNIDIKDAENVQFRRGGRITPETVSYIDVKGALQVIVNDDIYLDQQSKEALDECSSNGQLYILTNSSGIKDLLDFTETAGKYKVVMGSERCEVIAIDADGNVYKSADGYLVLPNEGEYIIDAKVTSAIGEYYVGASGVDTNNGKTSATPVATVTKAIELAKKDGFVVGDTVVIKFVGSDYTLAETASHSFDVKYTSAGVQTKVQLDVTNICADNIKANVTFDNVKLFIPSTWSTRYLNGANVHFTENCVLSGSYFSYCLLTNNGGGAATTPAGQRVVFESGLPYSISISNSGWASVKRMDDVELVFNSANGNANLDLNACYGGQVNGSTTYKNLNINIKALKSIKFNYSQNVTVSGAVQIIDSQGLGITEQTAVLADIDAPKYIINNNTGNKDIINFTDVAGVFSVDSASYVVIATDLQNNTYTSADGMLTLPKAGSYTLTINHTHTYDDICDEECNGCDYVRLNAHDYDNACDNECNKCHAERNAEHTFDNECDKLCNVCFEYRSTSHIFANDIDRDCENCGAFRTITGDFLLREEDGKYYYYKNGYKTPDTKLIKYSGKWFYIENGVWAKSYTGLVKFGGQWFYVVKGKWDTSVTKVLKKYEGKWFWIVKGKWNSKTEDLVKCDGVYFYIKGGKWDSKTATKLFEKNGTKFYIKGGKWNKATTLFKQGSKLVAIKSGKVTTAKVIIKYNGKKYYCYKGYAQTSKTGKVTVSGKKYTVKKGIVQ